MKNSIQPQCFQSEAVSASHSIDYFLVNPIDNTLGFVNNRVDTISGYFDSELAHNENLQQKVAEQILLNLVVKRQTLSYKQSKINIDSEIEKFLNFQSSDKRESPIRIILTASLAT